MDKKTYSLKTLEKKYDHFLAPSFEITVAGKVFASKSVHVTVLEVELSCDGTAGGCSFAVEGQYDHEKQKWENGVADVVEVGAKLEIKGGYVKKELIFFGYVDDYTLSFSENGAPVIEVTGLDGLGYLMSMREPIYAGKRKAADIVKEILGKSKSAGFAKDIHIGTPKGFDDTPIVKERVDDWTFLNLMAQRYGMSLFAVAGELIFDNVTGTNNPILTLKMGKDLYYFKKRVTLARQIGKVEIWGRDVNQKEIKGNATHVKVGSGKAASDIVSSIKKAALREYSELVRTKEDCTAMAQNRLNGLAMGFVTGDGACIGIPELIPGRYIEITGGDKKTNGRYFLSKVKHIFDNESYRTEFQIKGAKA
ncbi:MAG: phage late control D family protein [Oscillospiraceae bacterium]|nr:phage late control D family protein [Oscillospiraceae bacterium]